MIGGLDRPHPVSHPSSLRQTAGESVAGDDTILRPTVIVGRVDGDAAPRPQVSPDGEPAQLVPDNPKVGVDRANWGSLQESEFYVR